ncbi:Ger(x)C family spore germination protein [Cohnella sp. GbtcB17]|uniref:Ger(x)C family spore germination protein n=1 Tax=Cohnella sp. GbtcB17 TaxID=2824762 RepID=UPI001C30EC2D|nr:Ger(x)C family spore germination protein [Cohnella sp. GbtcB17]
MRKRLGIHSVAIALTIVLTMAGLTGCWSKQELNDRTFVSTMLVDLDEQGRTEISTMFLLPNRISVGLNASPGQDKPFVSLTGKGRDITEAFQQIQKDLPRTVAWGQMRTIIVGDRYARAGMAPLFDFLIRATDFRFRVYMFYFNGEARNIAKLTPVFERFPTEIWRESAHTRRLPPVNIRDLLYSQWNNLGDAYIPELRLRELSVLTEEKPVQWSGIGGAAIMKDNAVIGSFTADETMGITFMKSRTPELMLTAKIADPEGLFSVRLVDIKQSTRSERRGNKVLIHVSIDGKADLVSIQSKLDLHDPGSMRKLERALNVRIRDLAQSAADKAQEEHADVFQWSEYVKYKYPSLWRGWADQTRENLFASMKPVIHARILLRTPGISHSPRLYSEGGSSS